MIANSRLTELAALLDYSTGSLADRLWAFYNKLTTKGFHQDQALELTIVLVQSALAVPSPVESNPSTGH